MSVSMIDGHMDEVEGDLISRSALLKKQYNASELDDPKFADMVVDVSDIEDAPAVDAVEVVRCKDCKHWDSRQMECKNDALSTDHEGGASYSLDFWKDDFCSYGERKDDEICKKD